MMKSWILRNNSRDFVGQKSEAVLQRARKLSEYFAHHQNLEELLLLIHSQPRKLSALSYFPYSMKGEIILLKSYEWPSFHTWLHFWRGERRKGSRLETENLKLSQRFAHKKVVISCCWGFSTWWANFLCCLAISYDFEGRSSKSLKRNQQ